MQLRLSLEFREDLPERSWDLYLKVVFAES